MTYQTASTANQFSFYKTAYYQGVYIRGSGYTVSTLLLVASLVCLILVCADVYRLLLSLQQRMASCGCYVQLTRQWVLEVLA